jgi:hypothetical protein
MSIIFCVMIWALLHASIGGESFKKVWSQLQTQIKIASLLSVVPFLCFSSMFRLASIGFLNYRCMLFLWKFFSTNPVPEERSVPVNLECTTEYVADERNGPPIPPKESIDPTPILSPIKAAKPAPRAFQRSYLHEDHPEYDDRDEFPTRRTPNDAFRPIVPQSSIPSNLPSPLSTPPVPPETETFPSLYIPTSTTSYSDNPFIPKDHIEPVINPTNTSSYMDIETIDDVRTVKKSKKRARVESDDDDDEEEEMMDRGDIPKRQKTVAFQTPKFHAQPQRRKIISSAVFPVVYHFPQPATKPKPGSASKSLSRTLLKRKQVICSSYSKVENLWFCFVLQVFEELTKEEADFIANNLVESMKRKKMKIEIGKLL